MDVCHGRRNALCQVPKGQGQVAGAPRHAKILDLDQLTTHFPVIHLLGYSAKHGLQLFPGFVDAHRDRPQIIRGAPAWVRDNRGSERERTLRLCEEPTHSILEKVQQQLNQINVSLAGLCRPCPWEWELFQGSCYLFSRTLGSWEASVASCQNFGAHLVIVNSFEEQQFLKYLHIRKNELTWIGLSDHKHEGSWHWVDGTPLGLSFWKDGEPNNEGDEDCVELSEDKWNDKRCAAKNFWICEKPSAPCPGH
ncbi:hypothetical protein ACRRTK_008209 [Alexandromys fortis]